MTTHSSMFTGGVPFIAGSILGERCWDLMRDGTLRSPQMQYKWGKEENVSRCQVYHQQRWYSRLIYNHHPDVAKRVCQPFIPEGTTMVELGETRMWDSPPTAVIYYRPDHRTSEPTFRKGFVQVPIEMMMNTWKETTTHFGECQCGFYAYLTGHNDYRDWAFTPNAVRVTGVVEGFGETVIGERGFRSQKARILAAYVPTDPWSGASLELRRRMRRRYPHTMMFDDLHRMFREFPPTGVREALE